MKNIIIALLLISTKLFAQDTTFLRVNDSLRLRITMEKVAKPVVAYVPIPSAPVPQIMSILLPLPDCCGGGIFLARTGNVKTSGNFTKGLSFRQWPGPTTVINSPGDIYGSHGGTQHGISATDFANNLSFYGLDAAHPGIVKGSTGIQLPANVGGSHFVVQNFVADSTMAAGSMFNGDTFNGSYYGSTEISFFRSFNTGQEGICYIGATHIGFAYHDAVKVVNCLSFGSSREGTQFEHINILDSHNNTCIFSGQGKLPEQNNNFQAQDLGKGSSITYSIYDGAPCAFNVFTHGTSISHNYIGFTTYPGYIGQTDATNWSTSPRLSGDSLIFDGDYFNYTGPGTLPYLTEIAERKCPIIFRNCTFSPNILAIYKDSRPAGSTNTITGKIGDHGNVSAAIIKPEFTNFVWNDFEGHGLLTTPFYLKKKFGYRTP